VEKLPEAYVFHILGLDNIGRIVVLVVLLDIVLVVVLDMPAGVGIGLDSAVVFGAVFDILDTLLGVVPDMAAVVLENLGPGLVLDIPMLVDILLESLESPAVPGIPIELPELADTVLGFPVDIVLVPLGPEIVPVLALAVLVLVLVLLVRIAVASVRCPV